MSLKAYTLTKCVCALLIWGEREREKKRQYPCSNGLCQCLRQIPY
jgi:hypothetical protein